MRLTFRAYFLLGAVLYGANAVLLLFSRHFGWPTALVGHTPLTQDGLDVAYGMLFTTTATTKLVAAITSSTRAQRVAVIAGAGMASTWTLVTAIGTVFYNTTPGFPLTWAYIAIITYAIFPYARLSVQHRKELRHFSRTLPQRVNEVAETVHGPLNGHDGETPP